MAYATQADIETTYGASRLGVIADREGDGVVDADAVARALEDASDEIDTYLNVRYAVPMTEAPAIVRSWCVDLAIHRLALDRDVLTEEIAARRKAVIDALREVAKGDRRLVFPSDQAPTPDDDNAPNPVVLASGAERIFTRDTMGDL